MIVVTFENGSFRKNLRAESANGDWQCIKLKTRKNSLKSHHAYDKPLFKIDIC